MFEHRQHSSVAYCMYSWDSVQQVALKGKPFALLRRLDVVVHPRIEFPILSSTANNIIQFTTFVTYKAVNWGVRPLAIMPARRSRT